MGSINEVPLIPRASLFGAAERSNIKISPDGRYLSWIALVGDTKNIWVAPIDTPENAQPVTHDTQRGIHRYFWSFLGDVLLYRRDNGGDEDFHFYALNVNTLESRDLTPYQHTQAELLAMSPKHPDSVVIGMNDRDAVWHDVYQVNLHSGKRTLLDENSNGFFSYSVNNDYQPVFARKATEDGSYHWYRRNGKIWEDYFRVSYEDTLTTYPWGFNLSSDTLYLSDARGRNLSALYALDIASGNKQLIYADELSDIDNVLISPLDGEVEAVYVNYLEGKWVIIDSDLQADFMLLEQEFTNGFRIGSRTLDNQYWIVIDNAANNPGSYYLYHCASKTLRHLFNIRPKLVNAPLVPMWPVEILSRDNLALVSYLTLPNHSDPKGNGKPITPQPLVLLVHGGPWARDELKYHSTVQWLANRGYAVLQVNYRGSMGFGKYFINAASREWGGRMHDDLIDAVDWAIEQGITTHDQVAIFGGSYGGFASLVGMTFTPDRFICGIDMVGPSNLITFIETIPEYWKSALDEFSHRVGDFRSEEGRKFLWSRSPLSRVADIKHPLMIVHGANDPRIKQSESDQIVTAMKEKGVSVTYEVFHDEGHGLHRPENIKAFTATAEAFLAKHLGGRAEPIGNDLEGSSIEVLEGIEDIPGLKEALHSHEPVIRR